MQYVGSRGDGELVQVDSGAAGAAAQRGLALSPAC
jgi:hypothetical protein